jgi:hypothetical protein
VRNVALLRDSACARRSIDAVFVHRRTFVRALYRFSMPPKARWKQLKDARATRRSAGGDGCGSAAAAPAQAPAAASPASPVDDGPAGNSWNVLGFIDCEGRVKFASLELPGSTIATSDSPSWRVIGSGWIDSKGI